MQLLLTDKVGRGRSGHKHVVYLNDSDPTNPIMEMSIDKDHNHAIMPKLDPNTNELTIEFAPGGKDDHTHVIDMEVLNEEFKLPKKTDTELISNAFTLWGAQRSHEYFSFKNADLAYQYLQGFQWDANVISKLQKDNRASLTFNFLAKKMKTLSGIQRNNRTDIVYLPVSDDDPLAAEVANIIIRNAQTIASFQREETKVFEDSSGMGRGVFELTVDHDKDVEGIVRADRVDWKRVWFGPHENIDGSDADHLTKMDVLTKDRIMQVYPDKEKELETMTMGVDNDMMADYLSKDGVDWDGAEYSQRNGRDITNDRGYTGFLCSGGVISFDKEPLVDLKKNRMVVVHSQQKVPMQRDVVMAPNENDKLFFDNLNATVRKSIETIPSLFVIKQNSNVIRQTSVIGSVMLEDKIMTWPDGEPMRDFTTLPVYASKYESFWHGKVYEGMDAQDEINKRHSQATDILNKGNRNNTFYDGETFVDTQEENKYKNNAAKAGGLYKVGDVAKRPVKEESGEIPGSIMNMMSIDRELINNLMGVDEDLFTGGRAESGAALVAKERESLRNNEYIFDNLDITKERLGRLWLTMIMKLYSDERILRLVDNDIKSPESTTILNGAEVTDQSENKEDVMAQVMEKLRNRDLFKFDLVASQRATSPTQRRANFENMQTAAQQGVPIPPQLLIELSDLPTSVKTKTLAAMQAQSEAAAKQAEATNQTEVLKSMIGPMLKQEKIDADKAVESFTGGQPVVDAAGELINGSEPTQ